MERIEINTGLKSFLCIDRISEISDKHIKGAYTIKSENSFTAMESLAQLGALHVRYLTDFERFVFLLKINSFSLPDFPNGTFNITGNLIANSRGAYSYKLKAEDKNRAFFGEMVFGVTDFDSIEKKENSNSHYKKVFQCLTKNSKES
ncbi:MAG: hypothetical protein GY714_17480 [Desulfobacterales bacterium]|nr:hypothetical protein [Desulfobacterales bacterium]